jgi:hypothetical protein
MSSGLVAVVATYVGIVSPKAEVVRILGWFVFVLALVFCTIDFGTMMIHHHACAPKNRFDLLLRTERCLRPAFARAAVEPMRRAARGWS